MAQKLTDRIKGQYKNMGWTSTKPSDEEPIVGTDADQE